MKKRLSVFNIAIVVSAVSLISGIGFTFAAPTLPPPDGNPTLGGGGSPSLWTDDGSGNVYFDSGRVGVGTASATPGYALDIQTRALIGNGELGTSAGDSRFFSMGHSALDQTGLSNYALMQRDDGFTFINAAPGTSLSLRVGNGGGLTINGATNSATLAESLSVSGVNGVTADRFCLGVSGPVCKSPGTGWLETTVIQTTFGTPFWGGGTATATCPAGYKLTGCSGHFSQYGNGAGDYGGSYPSGNSCRSAYLAPGSGQIYSYAYCAR